VFGGLILQDIFTQNNLVTGMFSIFEF